MGFVLLLGGFCLRFYLQSRRLQNNLETEYRRTLSELTASAASLEESLVLLRYAATPRQTALYGAAALRQADDTVYLLGRLPFSAAESEDVMTALARIEVWVESLYRTDTAPGIHDSETWNRLIGAARVCWEVFAAWEQAAADRGTLSLFAEDPSETDDRDGHVAHGLQRLLAELEKLPVPDYGGENAVSPQDPLMLRGMPEISAGEALRAALDFTGLEDEQLRFLRRTDGRIPCYGIGGHLDGGEISLEITVQGGMVLSMMNSRKAEAKTLSLAEAQKNAEAFLRSRGYEGMVYCDVADREDTLLLQYVYSQEGILCYPDRIQLGVAADTGKIVSFESAGYLTHHQSRREMPSAVFSEAEAARTLHPDLSVETLSLCIILSDAQEEPLCYEAVCHTEDGRRLVFYIHAGTGEIVSLPRAIP